MRPRSIALLPALVLTAIPAMSTVPAWATQTHGQSFLCTSAALRATAAWQGVAGSIAGTITLRNRGAISCLLRGYPRVAIYARSGRIPTDELHSPSGPAGFPVGSTELVPGQASQVFLQWENYCGRAQAPVHLVITLPVGGQLTALVPGPPNYGGGADPRCGNPRKRSFVLVGTFQPAFDPGVVNLLAYYDMINRRDYAGAYHATRDSGVTRAQFVAGYRQTAHADVTRIAVAVYRVYRGDAAYACIGIQLSTRQVDGSHRTYGGWVMSEVRANKIAYVVIGGSRLRLDGALIVPPSNACAAAISRISSRL